MQTLIRTILPMMWLAISTVLVFVGAWALLDILYDRVGALSWLSDVDPRWSRVLPAVFLSFLGLAMHFHPSYRAVFRRSQ